MKARARVPHPTEDPRMNRTERRYSLILEAARRNGAIHRWDFEAVKLRLADSTFFTPDFRVILPDGRERFDEVKGNHIREDAMLKLKLAAEQHPYLFQLCQEKRGQGWIFTPIGARE